ncbi:MAG: 3-alpha-hydroxysteroid dehydrogenase, partial [Pseudomonadales bacterium]
DFRQLLGGETYDRIVDLTGRAGRPEDIAGLAEFLSVGDSHWINGVEITVDGGYYAGVVAGRH